MIGGNAERATGVVGTRIVVRHNHILDEEDACKEEYYECHTFHDINARSVRLDRHLLPPLEA